MQVDNPESEFEPSAGAPLSPVRRWWQAQSPAAQDRFAMLGPLTAVLLFLAAIATAFWYLHTQEIDRDHEAVKLDVEYAQQRLRLRLLERQEQLMRLARDLANKEAGRTEFNDRARALLDQYPELHVVAWVDENQQLVASQHSRSLLVAPAWTTGVILPSGDTDASYRLARDLQAPIYSQPSASEVPPSGLQLHAPLTEQGRFSGVIVGEYGLENLLRHGVPSEVQAKYAVALLDGTGSLLAGQSVPPRPRAFGGSLGSNLASEYEAPVSPVGNGLILRAQAWRSAPGLIGSHLFWLACGLSVLTAWMLIGNWRHTRRRLEAQHDLHEETAFRRSMENSMLTGMRALDLDGRITYVNAAFCQMTGWAEEELLNSTAPFPYWPEDDREMLTSRLADEINGRTTPGGFQVRVKRKEGSVFDARLYVSPLIDAAGKHTGWMTSMTDITEPNRIRDQLTASYERFTTVLDALDTSVSVAPLGSPELLFANRLYRQWFETLTEGHQMMAEQAGITQSPLAPESLDQVDGLAGLPTDSLTEAQSDTTEIFAPQLGKWLEVRSRYLNWVDGRLAQMVIATDITQRRHAEEQSAVQAERAQTASRLITMGEMASSVAHELNQPLTAISNYCNGMVSRIKNQQITEEDLLGALEKTARQAQRAGQIIQRIRSFVKRSEPNRTPAIVASMVEEALELADIELRRRHVRLSHELAEDLPLLMVDPILIEQVLVNLLRNAAEAVDAAERPSSQRNVLLRVAPMQIDNQAAVQFSVIDSGKGLAPEAMERLYQAFFSTKPEGMGIGLNLCRSIVESHQGRITAENLYNSGEVTGCHFSFWIPAAELTQTKAASSEDSGVNT